MLVAVLHLHAAACSRSWEHHIPVDLAFGEAPAFNSQKVRLQEFPLQGVPDEACRLYLSEDSAVGAIAAARKARVKDVLAAMRETGRKNCSTQ